MIKVWDIWLRLFHWSLVCTVCFSLISGVTGVGFLDWHRFAGEIVLALIVFRLLWGVFGSSNAHLRSLIVNPVNVLHHFRSLAARKPAQERGHNAAGGWAVLVMLLLLSMQAITGLFIADDEEWVEGAFHGVLSQANSDFLYNIHHMNADLLKLILILHVVMIAAYFLYAGQNLVKPMITGRMKWVSKGEPPQVRFGHIGVGLVLVILVGGATALGFGWFRL